jgi:hypothetical protein
VGRRFFYCRSAFMSRYCLFQKLKYYFSTGDNAWRVLRKHPWLMHWYNYIFDFWVYEKCFFVSSFTSSSCDRVCQDYRLIRFFNACDRSFVQSIRLTIREYEFIHLTICKYQCSGYQSYLRNHRALFSSSHKVYDFDSMVLSIMLFL